MVSDNDGPSGQEMRGRDGNSGVKGAAGSWARVQLHLSRARPVFRDAAGLLGERSSCRASPAPGRLQQSHSWCTVLAKLLRLRCAG